MNSAMNMDIESIKQNAEKTGKCGDALFWWQLGGDLYIEGQGEICMDAFSWDDSIRRVKIAPGCTGIGSCAFLDCELESVELPDGLVRIDACAFSVRAPLSLTVPDSVTSIGYKAFENVDEIIYGGRVLPESNDNWGAARWTGRLITQDFGSGPLYEEYHKLFGSTALGVYANAVEWGDRTPVPGEEMDVVVRYPFHCTVGDPFWAKFFTPSLFRRELSEDRFVQAKLLSVQESDKKSAKVRIMILQVRDMTSFAEPVSEEAQAALREQHTYGYTPPYGDLYCPYVRSISPNLFSVYNTLGGGDIDLYDYIYTDEDSIDHLVCTSSDGAFCGIGLGDKVLGYHDDFPYQWENDLLIDPKTKTVLYCRRDAKEVVVPDGIVRLGYECFSDCDDLEQVTVPDSVTDGYASFTKWGYHLSNLKRIILNWNPGRPDSDFASWRIPDGVDIIRKP